MGVGGVENGQANAVAVGKHVGIPEPQEAKAGAFKISRAASIVGGPITVLAAIDLNDQARIAAQKVENVRTEGDLALPGHAVEATRAQRVPEVGFGVGVVVTHRPGAVEGQIPAEASDLTHR